ncbi:MAG: hypothetical protein ACOZNI_09310 [Myxococcota bacterium]
MSTETLTLFDVDPFDPHELVVVLGRLLSSEGVSAEFERAGSALRVSLRGPSAACERGCALLPAWYRTWRGHYR